MNSDHQSDKSVMIILADNSVFCFQPTMPRGDGAKLAEPATRLAQIGAFLKSFAPKVSRITPIETKLAMGRRIRLHSPAPAV